MATLDPPKPLQYITDSDGRRTGVLLDIRVWDALADWIENALDTQLAVGALKELPAGGRPHDAGWLSWEEVREHWR